MPLPLIRTEQPLLRVLIIFSLRGLSRLWVTGPSQPQAVLTTVLIISHFLGKSQDMPSKTPLDSTNPKLATLVAADHMSTRTLTREPSEDQIQAASTEQFDSKIHLTRVQSRLIFFSWRRIGIRVQEYWVLLIFNPPLNSGSVAEIHPMWTRRKTYARLMEAQLRPLKEWDLPQREEECARERTQWIQTANLPCSSTRSQRWTTVKKRSRKSIMKKM